MPTDAKHVPYAKETAICVDLAYGVMEDEIRAELQKPGGPTQDALERLLRKLQARRKVLDEFTKLVGNSA